MTAQLLSNQNINVNEYIEEYFSYIQDKDTIFYDSQFHCNSIFLL